MKTKAILKKIVAAGCAAVMLMTLSGAYVSADELQGEPSTYEIYEEPALKATEAVLEASETVAETIAEETSVSEESVTFEEEAIDPEIEEFEGEYLVGGTNNHSRDEAVAWANSQVGKSLDYDGVSGAQCVDLTKYYYAYLGQSVPSGNANTYGNGGKFTPSGWTYQSSPLPGDIAVWTGGQYGHVAIVTEIRGSQMVCVEQNYSNKQYVTANLHNIDAQKYIRPDFPSAVYVSFTPWSNDNYTYIGKTDASIGMEINVSGGSCSSTGMYLYDSNGTYLASASNPSYTLARVYFQINAEMGYTLSPGTIYKYKFFAVVNGQTYWSDEGSFITLGRVMTSGYSSVLPDGDYQIVSAANAAYYLDIEGTAVPAGGGTNVTLCGPDAGHLPAYEIWNLTYSDGFYTIRQKDTDVCLDVANADTAASANIQMCQSNGSNAQKWAISQFGDIGYRVQAKCSGLSLDIYGASISSGTNIQQYPNNNSYAQRWLFIPYDPEKTIADGRYILVSALNPNLVLDISGDTANVSDETNVQVWNDSASSRYNSIDVKYLDYGYYRLTHSASGKSLDVYGSAAVSGTNVQIFTAGEQNNQKWAITKQGSGYVIWSRCSGLVLDVLNAGTSDGTNVVTANYNGSDAQIWKFVQAEYKVSYDANGGTGAPSSQTKYYRNTLTLSSIKPTRSGYTFKGWATSKTASSAEYQAGGSYTQDKSVTLYAVWAVQTKPISNCTITLSPTSYTYDGAAKKPSVTVKDGNTALVSGTDYTLSYSNNTNAGTATVTITGKGNYTGTVSRDFMINKASPTLKFASTEVSKTTLDGPFTNTLTKTTDGTVTFSSSDANVAAVDKTGGQVTVKGEGTATITATAAAGKNYKAGSASYTVTVADGRTDIAGCTVTLSPASYTYDGTAKKPSVTVKDGSTTLTSGTDYTAAYKNNTNAGTATVTVTGKGNYTGTVSKTFKIGRRSIADAAVEGVSDRTYNGSEQIQEPVVKVGGRTLTSGTDYTLSYGNNVNAGTATVTATGKGNYTGTVSKNFTISQAAPTLKFAKSSLTKTEDDAAFTNKLTATTDGTITYKSDNTAVASVNKTSGKVTIKGVGKATITATAAAGENYKAGSAKYTLTVNKNGAIQSISLSETSITMVYGKERAVPAVAYSPEDTTDTKTVDWGSSNEATATVSGGVIKAMNPGKAVITATVPGRNVSASANVRVLFSDVTDAGLWYFEPVYWALDNNITSGYGKGTFQPTAGLTRAQTVAFLYKLAGSPDVGGLATQEFTDVKKGDWYYPAVKWAAANKITSGYKDGTFRPNADCTRAMIVSFLMSYSKLVGTYVASVSSAGFSDVPPGAWYKAAVDWAVENEITKGYGTGTFSPDMTCNRAMMVTFLKKAAELPKVY